MKLKGFTRLFGGKFMKYWYIATVVVIALMYGFYLNDKNIEGYSLTIYQSNGEVMSEYFIDIDDQEGSFALVKELEISQQYGMFGSYIDNQLMGLPVTKTFYPKRKL